MSTILKALADPRVSTDDRGQDPLRQRETIDPWAAREGVTLVEPPEIDEGTSASKTNPLERKKFIAACERARREGCVAIVVEVGDRFGRRGSMESAWAEFEMGRRYGLKLWRADKPLAQHGTMLGRVTDTIHDEGAHDWVQKHAEKVRTGMARKKAEGARFGRPPKLLTPAEIDLVLKLRAKKVGWGRCARAVCDERKAHRIVDPDRRRKVEVSGSHVRRVILALPKVDPVQKVPKAS